MKNEMGSKQIPELNYLLSQVEKRYDRRIATTTDFEALSVVIERDINELVSASTLKRMWGYVSSKPVPRVATLDILSRFIGKQDFRDFCDSLKNTPDFDSGFFSAKYLIASELGEGAQVTIGWSPNRVVKLKHISEDKFVVESSLNSHLKEGDEFEVSVFMLGYPLYISRILREGQYTPSYIAGAADGLTILEY